MKKLLNLIKHYWAFTPFEFNHFGKWRFRIGIFTLCYDNSIRSLLWLIAGPGVIHFGLFFITLIDYKTKSETLR